MMNNPKKIELLSEFDTMKRIEQDAHDFYVRAAQDPTVADQTIRNCFAKIAQDEKHHVELVDRIINIIQDCL